MIKIVLVCACVGAIVSSSAQAETFYAACYRSEMRLLMSPEAIAANEVTVEGD